MFRVLTVKQPWADVIVQGKKDVENRGWSVNWRGVVLIHASKIFDLDGYELLRKRKTIRRTPEKFPTGVIVGAVVLSNCIPYRNIERNPAMYDRKGPSEWHEAGKIGWYFEEEVVKFEHPLPASGRQGLWFAPPALSLTKPDPDPEDPENVGVVVVATLLDMLGNLGGSNDAQGRGTVLT